jgi:ribosomal protein S18 acetylase RimI-like enzyme
VLPADADVARMKGALRERGAVLAYLFVGSDAPALHRRLEEGGAILYDERVTYAKRLAAEPQPGVAVPGDNAVEAYSGGLTDELLGLAILAGHESRFRKDPRLLPFFEALYQLWMVNSLEGTMADVVFIYRPDAGIKGMVTCKTGPGGVGNIGLIATDIAWQGKGVGGKLIRAAEAYFRTKGMETCTVVTQRTNAPACEFYERSGFSISKTEYIYHLWFN